MAINTSLKGLSVLITRPAGQAVELLQLIESAGGKAYHCPVMAIGDLDNNDHAALIQNNKQKVLELDNYQHIIAISTNAVKHGMELINQYWPQLPMGLNWYAIGKTTAAELKGDTVITVKTAPGTSANSETLLMHEQLQQLKHQKVLIIRGIGGRDFLRQQLCARGAKVDYLECYLRKKDQSSSVAVKELIAKKTVNCICLNSAESIDYFSELLGVELLTAAINLAVIVPSQRVADHARKKSFSHVIVAENASNNAVVTALYDVFKQIK